MACSPLDPAACAASAAAAVTDDAITSLANAVLEAFGKAVASLGTIWVDVGTPNLTGAGGASPVAAGSSAPDSGGVTTAIAYVEWIALAVAVLSLFALGASAFARARAGQSVAAIGRGGVILGGVLLIASASAVVAAALPTGPVRAGGAVAFLQSSLWWYMGAAAVLSVVVGGIRMAWEQRAAPGLDTLKSLITLVVVAGAGVTVIGLLTTAADSFSVWLLDGSLSCDITAPGGACFGENMAILLALSANPVTAGLGPLLIIFLGLVAIVATVIQIVLMIARGAMLVILAGVLPVAASATNTDMGRAWFTRTVGWTAAFILYKPAAAIVYATAFQLAGSNLLSDDGSGLLAVLSGLTLMILALFALPALMRFTTPLVGAIADADLGAVTIGGLAVLPTGAATVQRMATGAMSTGSAGAEAAGTATAGTATAGAATAGASTAGATTAGAVAGPAGLAAGVALDAATKTGRGVADAARSTAKQLEGDEPRGST